MSIRSVVKYAEWLLAPDRSQGASSPVREIECTTCGERSEASTGQLGPDSWALGHAGAHPQHTGYREITTAFLRVMPAEGNPLRRSES